ncbi:MAG: hypothetical protein QXL15_00885 [Candidatus Korarchaeota archaeon]
MKNEFIAFVICFLIGFAIVAPMVSEETTHHKNTTVLSDIRVEKAETFHLNYAPDGSLLSKAMESTISVKNKGNIPAVVNITDRVRGIDVNNMQFLYGRVGTVTPFPDAISPDFYYVKWESVPVKARNKTMVGYMAPVTVDPPLNISVGYKVNGTDASLTEKEGVYYLYAPVGTRVTICLNITNLLQPVFTPQGLVRPPSIALITMMFDAASLEEPISKPAPAFSLQLSGILTVAWAATFGFDISSLQAMNISFSGLNIDPNALPDFVGMDIPYSLEINTTIVGNGSWGFVKLPSISIMLAVDMSVLGPTLDSVVQLIDGLELGLSGVAYLLSYYSMMFNSSIDFLLDSFVRWNSLITERDVFARIINESTQSPVNLRPLDLYNATVSTLVGLISAEIALNGVPPNGTWRNSTHANITCTYYNSPIYWYTDAILWFNLSTRLRINPANNHTEIEFLSRIFFDKYWNNQSVIFNDDETIVGLDDSFRIRDYNIPSFPLLNVATVGGRQIVWRVLPDASHSYDLEFYTRINGTIDVTALMQLYGGSEANATEVSNALNMFGLPGLYNFSQLLLNMSEYIHRQNVKLKTLADIGRHQKPLFGYFSIQNESGSTTSIKLENFSLVSAGGVWRLRNMNVSLIGDVDNATINVVAVSIPSGLSEEQIWAILETPEGEVNVSYWNLTYLGIRVDLQNGRMYLYPDMNISRNETLDILTNWNATPIDIVFNVSQQPILSIISSDVIPIYLDVENRGTSSAASAAVKEVSVKTQEFVIPPIYIQPPPAPQIPWLEIGIFSAATIGGIAVIVRQSIKRKKSLKGLDIALSWLQTRRTYWRTQKLEIPQEVLEEYTNRVAREVRLFKSHLKGGR